MKGVKLVTISRSPACPAQKIAASAHVPGQEVAKSVMVKLDDRMSTAVLPAPDQVSFGALKEATGGESFALASEEKTTDLFPNCEVGAMPPFERLVEPTVLQLPTRA